VEIHPVVCPTTAAATGAFPLAPPAVAAESLIVTNRGTRYLG